MNETQTLQKNNLLKTQSLNISENYVGIELNKYYFDDENLNYQFLNGVSLKKCLFEFIEIKHTEIREAFFEECQFIECDLTSSDLVYSKFNNCIFINCTFTNGEWIESEFINCKFYNSEFNHTTVNLTIYNSCTFDKESFQGLNEPSVQFNIIINSSFSQNVTLTEVVDKNFGITSLNNIKVVDESIDLFIQLSRLFFVNKLPTIEFIKLSSSIIEQLLEAKNKSYLLRIKYLSLICRSYIEVEKVSPFGIQRLEKSMSKVIQQSNSDHEGLYVELVQLIMVIRIIYSNRISEIEESILGLSAYNQSIIISFKLFFNKTYTSEQVKILQNYIADYCEIDQQSIKYSINHGSTEIVSELVNSIPVYLTAIYGAYVSVLKAVELTTKTAKNVTGDIVAVKENLNKLSKLKQSSIKVETENSSKLETINKKSIKLRNNTIETLNGTYKSEIALKTANLACVESKEKILEMEDYANLEIIVKKYNN